MHLSHLSALLFALPFGITSSSAEKVDTNGDGYEPYLAPHEKRVYDALGNIANDFDAFLDTFADDAYCELTFGKDPNDVTTQSGPCHDIVSHVGSDMVQYKLNWQTLTNSHPDHPERGVLSMIYGNYGLTSNGCEGLWFGIGEMKFDKHGQLGYLSGQSSEMLDFMNCIEENDKDRVQEEIYLAPHEQNLFDAMDSINEDSDAIMTILAANAQCEIISGQDPDDIVIKSGPCIDVWSRWTNNIVNNKIKWEPMTNTHVLYPDKGLLSFKFWHYAFSENGCESLFGGSATVKFNEDGLVTHAKTYSTRLMDFMDCLNEIDLQPHSKI